MLRPLELKGDGESEAHPTLLVLNSLPLRSLGNGGEGPDVHPGWGWKLQLYALPVTWELQVARRRPTHPGSQWVPRGLRYHAQVLSHGLMAGGGVVVLKDA